MYGWMDTCVNACVRERMQKTGSGARTRHSNNALKPQLQSLYTYRIPLYPHTPYTLCCGQVSQGRAPRPRFGDSATAFAIGLGLV